MKDKQDRFAKSDTVTFKGSWNKPQHTPTPWKADLSTVYWMSPNVDQHNAESDMDNIVCSVIRRPDAAFIVRAVNSHEELLAIAKDALSINEEYERKTGVTTDQTKRVREAIAKAEGL